MNKEKIESLGDQVELLSKLNSIVEKKGKGKGSLDGVGESVLSITNYVLNKLIFAGWTFNERVIYTKLAISGDYDFLISVSKDLLEDKD